MVLLSLSTTSASPDRGNLQFRFPLSLNNDKSLLALRSCTIPYSWYNICSNYKNNEIKYSNSEFADIWKIVTIPDGLHDLDGINYHLSVLFNSDKIDESPILFLEKPNTIKTLLMLKRGYKIDMSYGELYKILGLEPKIYDKEEVGKSNIDITRSVKSILVHCPLVDGSYTTNHLGEILPSDIIFTFVPNLPPGSDLVFTPNPLICLPVNRKDYIREVEIYITDNLNRKVDLNGETCHFTIEIIQ